VAKWLDAFGQAVTRASSTRACARLTQSLSICSRHERSAAAADSLAAFLQLGMQPVQTVQAAEPVASGGMRPALARRRNAAAVGTPGHWPYQHDTHHCSTQALTTTVIRGIRPQPLRLPWLSAPNNPWSGPKHLPARHTLQWPVLFTPGSSGFGGERHDGRTITWPLPCRMSWQGAIASTRRRAARVAPRRFRRWYQLTASAKGP
jgi:hypothetical protein